jgi:hypothetical protein
MQRSFVCLAFGAAFADAWRSAPAQSWWQKPARSRGRYTAPQLNANAQSFWQKPGRPAVRNTAPQLNIFRELLGSWDTPNQIKMTKEEMDAKAAELGVQVPQYEVLRTSSEFEVRRYQRLQMIDCMYEQRNEGYFVLGRYAKRKLNAAGEKMGPTAPQIIFPMAKPKRLCSFLPSPYTPSDASADPVPAPASDDPDQITVRDVSPMVVAVRSFPDYSSPENVFNCRDALVKALSEEGITLPDGATEEKMIVASYNEFYKDELDWDLQSEVWLRVNPDSL